MDNDQIICNWSTYKGNHCKKIICLDENKKITRFCSLHRELIAEYSRIKIENNEELCETFKEIKVVPRSFKHIKSIMSSFGIDNEDDIVQVYIAGGSVEEAEIKNIDYILLISDNSRFYYNPIRGQKKAKDLKIILRQYCQHECIVSFAGIKYCEECYKKNKDAPRISLIS